MGAKADPADAAGATVCMAYFRPSMCVGVLATASVLLHGCIAPLPDAPQTDAACPRTVHADVVALEQAYVLNRFAAFVPAGMLYALRDDVVPVDSSRPLGVEFQ